MKIPLVCVLVTMCLQLLSFATEKTLAEVKAGYQKADKQLNLQWKNTIRGMTKDSLEEFKKDQRDWISYRDYMADWQGEMEARQTGGKKEDSVDYWSTMAWITESRVKFLKAWAQKATHEWNGVYRDSRGGLLMIHEEKGKVFFSVQVVRGPTFHTGGLAGEGKANQSTARYTDLGKEEGKEKETWITLVKNNDGKRIQLIGENTGHYHGARAYFDGVYLRVAQLTEKEIKQLKTGELEE